MSNVYVEKPNIVSVKLADDSGEAERFIVGKTLDEAIAMVTGEKLPAWVGEKKTKRGRKPKPVAQEQDAAAPKPASVWPE